MPSLAAQSVYKGLHHNKALTYITNSGFPSKKRPSAVRKRSKFYELKTALIVLAVAASPEDKGQDAQTAVGQARYVEYRTISLDASSIELCAITATVKEASSISPVFSAEEQEGRRRRGPYR